MGENCKDCPYVEALDKRVEKIEIKIESMEDKLNIATTENEKTKVYFEKIIDKIDSLIERFDTKIDSLAQRFDNKMLSFETRLEKVEKALEEKSNESEKQKDDLTAETNKNTFIKLFFNKYEKLVIAIIVTLSALAGLNLSGVNVVDILTK